MSKQWLPLFILIFTLVFYPQHVLSANFLSICQIQGAVKTSPHAGKQVQTEGVVTADFDDQSERGFFIQDENCDGQDSTSDGIFVYIGVMENVATVGDRVSVNGTVEEDFGLTRINANPAGVIVLSSGNLLLQAVDFAPPFDNCQSDGYFEARESMLIRAGSTVVVGPTDAREKTYVVRAELGIGRVFQDDPAGTGEIIPIGSDGVYQIEPDAQVGDQILNLEGVLDFRGGDFEVRLATFPTLIRPSSFVVAHESAPVIGSTGTNFRSPLQTSVPFSIATLNLHNLFDTVNDPDTQDSVLEVSEYQRKLKKLALTIHEIGEPTLVAVQEAENNDVLQALANRPEISTQYAFVWEDGPDRRGIDVALLYQMDRVVILSAEARQGCTTLIDGLGPDGNHDLENPSNGLTCDTNGDGINDGNRLFSRPPLVVLLRVCAGTCGGGGAVRDLWIIAVHLKSKSEDTGFTHPTLPRRFAQAQFVAGLYAEVSSLDTGAEVIALGDFNDFPDSQPMAALSAAGLASLMPSIPHASAYTYIYQGVSQVLDYVLISPNLMGNPDDGLFTAIVHLNADYPVFWQGNDLVPRRASDHEPVLVNAIPLPYKLWMPVILLP